MITLQKEGDDMLTLIAALSTPMTDFVSGILLGVTVFETIHER